MTAKNRKHSSNNAEKSAPAAAAHQDEAPKKAPKTSSSNGVSGVSGAPQGGSGSSSSSCIKLLAAVCYIALITAAGIAAIYLQQVLEEVHQITAKSQESARENAELTRKTEGVLQQVEWLLEPGSQEVKQ